MCPQSGFTRQGGESPVDESYGRPVAGLDTHELDGIGVEAVESPEAAVEYVEGAVTERR